MKATVLLIEDEDDVRSIVTDILLTSDYEVLSASDAFHAFEILNSGSIPDLIISDIMMPGKSGIEFYIELRDRYPLLVIPFIFLTAKSDDSDCREGMNLGVDDYLKKPFKTSDLLRSIELRLTRKKLISDHLISFQKTTNENIPHELRTPLVPIVGLSSLLIDDYEELSKDEVKHFINEIHQSGLHLKERVNKLLVYRELETLDLSWAFNIVKPNSIISKTGNLDLMLLEIANQFNRSSDIVINIEEAELLIIPQHLNILLTEILENCFKFSSDGSRVEVYGTLENNYYEFKINDYGSGFIIKDIGKEVKRTLNANNTGFGLPIIEKILKLYRTRLILKSSPGCGTKISFSINLKDQNIVTYYSDNLKED